jgi:hypothetical protein
MKRSMLIRGLTALAVCALALPALTSDRNPVERPLDVAGHAVLIVNPVTGDVVSGGAASSNWGVASHAGLFQNEVTGNMVTGLSGTITAANGDQIDWVATDPVTISFTGGTGRFESVSGEFTALISDDYSEELVTNPDGTMTLIISYTYTGTGTITY